MSARGLVGSTTSLLCLALFMYLHRHSTLSSWRETLAEWLDKVRRTFQGDAHDDEQEEEVNSISSSPESRPVKTVAGLMSWTPPAIKQQGQDSPRARQERFCAAPLPGSPFVGQVPVAAPKRPRLLVCHDMQGGYKADRWVQGCDEAQSFNLWRWECVDILCYFSHSLITIPPPTWIAAAHTHNSLVLGTFITEWASGRRKCEQLFASRASAQQAAEQLAKLAAYHGFDGWLINLENGLGATCRLHLLHFLNHLRASLKTLCGQQSMLIWYDALTTDGTLTWQNDLTPLNQVFFDACDAIYLNYGWGADTPQRVAATAGMRGADVFMGVDVWGRGTYGGGQDTCDVALSAAHSAGLSAALFAPGWLYEAFPPAGLIQRTDTWWNKVASVWPARQQPALGTPTCFVSSLCRGYGLAGRWLQGRLLSSTPWHHLAAQQPQPNPSFIQLRAAASLGPTSSPVPCVWRAADSSAHDSSWAVCVCERVGFSGGTCLQVSGSVAALQQGPVLCHLFNVHLPVSAAGFHVSLAAAPLTQSSSTTQSKDEEDSTGSQLEGSGRGDVVRGGAAADAELAVVLWVTSAQPPTARVVQPDHPSTSSLSQPLVLLPASHTPADLAALTLPAVPCASVPLPPRVCPSDQEQPLNTAHSSARLGNGSSVHWRTSRLRVDAGALPPGCIITGLGVVTWASAPGAPVQLRASAVQQQDAATSTDYNDDDDAGDKAPSMVSWLLGHLSVTAVDLAPSQTTASLNVHLVRVQHQWQQQAAGCCLALSCDVHWQVPRCADGRPAHTGYHLWVRLLQPQQLPSDGQTLCSTPPDDVEQWTGRELNDAGTWVWLGQAYHDQYHAMLCIPASLAGGSLNHSLCVILEWCVESIQYGDGLVGDTQWRHTTCITQRQDNHSVHA